MIAALLRIAATERRIAGHITLATREALAKHGVTSLEIEQYISKTEKNSQVGSE